MVSKNLLDCLWTYLQRFQMILDCIFFFVCYQNDPQEDCLIFFQSERKKRSIETSINGIWFQLFYNRQWLCYASICHISQRFPRGFSWMINRSASHKPCLFSCMQKVSLGPAQVAKSCSLDLLNELAWACIDNAIIEFTAPPFAGRLPGVPFFPGVINANWSAHAISPWDSKVAMMLRKIDPEKWTTTTTTLRRSPDGSQCGLTTRRSWVGTRVRGFVTW